MNARNSFLDGCFVFSTLLAMVFTAGTDSQAINIVVDYRYDTNNFFNTQQKRDAMQAVADRYSNIITTSLSEAVLLDNSSDWRIGFNHPGTGASYQVSAASSFASDSLYSTDPADEYRGPWTLAADDYVIYAGGRSLANSAGVGGTRTGLNFTSAFTSGSSHLNRGFRTTGSVTNLPMWGGAITFDNDADRTWHFDLDTASPFSSTDFYSIALHEVGHVLGLATSWQEWDDWSAGGTYSGPKAVAAYNADNSTSLTSLNEVGGVPLNHHWQDGTYESKIFAGGSPVQVGTVGTGNLQDLLMEPTANFNSSQRRFELTNVDVAALEDLGWSVISAPVGLPGDYNGDNVVNAADYTVWLDSLGGGTLLNEGASLGTVDSADYDFWKSHFGDTLAAATGSENAPIPEPSTVLLIGLAVVSLAMLRVHLD